MVEADSRYSRVHLKGNLEDEVNRFSAGPFRGIGEVLRSASKRIYLDNGIYIDPLLGVGLKSIEEIRVDRTNQVVLSGGSAHQISFLNLSYRTSSDEVSLPVASKHYSRNKSGASELLKMRKVESLGVSVYQPLMYLKSDEGSYLFTKTNFAVIGLDRYNWGDLYDASSYNHGKSKEILGGIGKSLALIHSMGISHGDPQLKNFVVDFNGRVKIVDWEAAVFNKKIRIEDLALKDLSVLYRSCIGMYDNAQNSLFKGRGIDTWNMFEDLILDSYKISLMYRGIDVNNEFEEVLNTQIKRNLFITS